MIYNYSDFLTSQTFNPILVDFFDPDSFIPSSFQKNYSRILFGEGDTAGFKNFINDFNVFTCLPSSMAEEKGKEWVKHNLKIKTKFPSIIIIMDMKNKEHVNKLGNLFEDSVSYCKVNRHGVGPDNDCIFKILKNNGEYNPNYFQDTYILNNKNIVNILNNNISVIPHKFILTNDVNVISLFYNLKRKIEDLKNQNKNIVIEIYDELINEIDVRLRLALFISLKYTIKNIDNYKLKPKFGKDDNKDFKFTFTWIKVCSKKNQILCGKKSISYKKDLPKLSKHVDDIFNKEKIKQSLFFNNIDKKINNKSNTSKFNSDPRFYFYLDKKPKTLTINYDKSQIKNDYNKKNKDIILRNIFEKNMFILDAFEDLKNNILTQNLLKYLLKNNIFYNISFGFHSFQGVRTIENAEVEILFAFANYKNISLNNNNYFFIKQN